MAADLRAAIAALDERDAKAALEQLLIDWFRGVVFAGDKDELEQWLACPTAAADVGD